MSTALSRIWSVFVSRQVDAQAGEQLCPPRAALFRARSYSRVFFLGTIALEVESLW